jgi:hypothetical protein
LLLAARRKPKPDRLLEAVSKTKPKPPMDADNQIHEVTSTGFHLRLSAFICG